MAVIFRDKKRDGLLFQFLTQYKSEFGGVLNPSCSSCRLDYWTKYQNLFNMKAEVVSLYRLKAKYNGMQLGANGQPIRNGEMTDAIAEELLSKHPAGALLFDVMPEPKAEVVKEIKKKESYKSKK